MAVKQIADQVYFSSFDGTKFNRCSISIHLCVPAVKAFATDEAVLALVLGRGYRLCPDMTELTKKLAELYGAELSVTTSVNGANRVLSAEIIGIKNAFALNGENLVSQYLDILNGVLFDPYLINGKFDETAVAIEKAQLKRDLESEIDNKRTYCIQQARRRFYGDSPCGVERDGYLEQLDAVNADTLMQTYRRLLMQARIDIIAVGDDRDIESAQQSIQAKLNFSVRQPVQPIKAVAMPRQKEECFLETFETEQAKLCMLFTSAEKAGDITLASARLAMYLFGGAPTSRLFMNVREKKSLCYYCSAAYSFTNGTMMIDSGIQPANVAALKRAALDELNDLAAGNITVEELEDCRRGLICAVKGIGDSLPSLVGWYYNEIFRGQQLLTPQEAADEILHVTADDVAQVLKSMTLSVSYLLCAKQEASNDQ